jgi:hypothetical protein
VPDEQDESTIDHRVGHPRRAATVGGVIAGRTHVRPGVRAEIVCRLRHSVPIYCK